MLKKFILIITLISTLNTVAFEGQKQQRQIPPAERAQAPDDQQEQKVAREDQNYPVVVAHARAAQRVQLQLPPYDNGAACPINDKLQNDLFMQEVMPNLDIDFTNPLSIYNSLNELLSYATVSKKFASIVKEYIKELKQKIKSKELNIDATDILGQTALHYAAMKKNHQLAMLLISFGADVNAKTILNVQLQEEFESGGERNAVLYKYLPPLIGSFFNYIYLGTEDVHYFINDFTPMHFAILNNDKAMIDIFVRSGFKIQERTTFIKMIEPPTKYGDILSSFTMYAEFHEIIPQISEFLKAHVNIIKQLLPNYKGKYKHRKEILTAFDILIIGFKPESSSIENLILEYSDYNLYKLVYSQEFLDAYRKSLNE